MPKETTSENICQKRPLLSGGTPGPGDTWTCRHPHWRQALPRGHAATPIGGRPHSGWFHRPWRWPTLPRGHAATPTGGRPCHVDMPPPSLAAGPCHVDMPPPPLAAGPTAAGSILQRQHAGDAIGGRPLPAPAQAARATCRLARGCRHSEGVFFGKYFQRWSLLAFHWCRWSLLSKIPINREGTSIPPVKNR
jgi:hypothetical protein